MTDNEIIKALEYCSNPDNTCKKCDLYVAGGFDGCKCASKLKLEVVDLIKRKNAKIKSFEGKIVIQNGLIDRQKAEIEKLKEASEEAVSCFHRMESLYNIKCMELKVAKAEAVKEFVERLKEELEGEYIKATNKLENAQNIVVSTNIKIVDNLVKEMVGETDV